MVEENNKCISIQNATHGNCTFLPSNAAIIVLMWRQSCRFGYGFVMIPLCSVPPEWLIHSKQACWKGSATWVEHTVWVIQHVLIETSGSFSLFCVQCMWTTRPPDLLSSTDSGQGRRFAADGSDIQRNIPPLGAHRFLKFWKEKKRKRKSNQTD